MTWWKLTNSLANITAFSVIYDSYIHCKLLYSHKSDSFGLSIDYVALFMHMLGEGMAEVIPSRLFVCLLVHVRNLKTVHQLFTQKWDLPMGTAELVL